MKTRRGLTAVIIAAVLIITALIAAIVYIIADMGKEPDDGTEEAGVGTVRDDLPSEATDDAMLDALLEEADSNPAEESRPDGWYGDFESVGRPERVINFTPYTAKCPDVYAWIEIPGTNIDYPVAYCEDAFEPFWFTHDLDGNESEAGMIITDSLNGKDFSDPMTLIYGQAPDDGTMFAHLHDFRDAAFFDEHDRINIYMNDVQLVYRIYACYIASSEHILVNNDFSDPAGFAGYFDSIKDVRDLALNIRDDAKPSLGDHVIALITHCGDDSKRLFVHAVLEEIRF